MIIYQETNEAALTGGAVSYWLLGMFPMMVSVTGLEYLTETIGELKIKFHRTLEEKARFHRTLEEKAKF